MPTNKSMEYCPSQSYENKSPKFFFRNYDLFPIVVICFYSGNIFLPLVRIGGVWIEIKKGNIITESVRGIVNTTNKEMNLTGGVLL